MDKYKTMRVISKAFEGIHELRGHNGCITMSDVLIFLVKFYNEGKLKQKKELNK